MNVIDTEYVYTDIIFTLVTEAAQFFFFNDTAPTEIYTLSLHDALPISGAEPYALREYQPGDPMTRIHWKASARHDRLRSEEHTSELQSLAYLVCRLLLEKKKATEAAYKERNLRLLTEAAEKVIATTMKL